MSEWLVVWITFSCPFWMPAKVPAIAKPYLCKQVNHAQDFEMRAIALQVVQEAGPDGSPMLFKVDKDGYTPAVLKFKSILED